MLVARHSRADRSTAKDRLLPDIGNLAATYQWIAEEGGVELGVRWYETTHWLGTVQALGVVRQPWERWHQDLMDRRDTIPVQTRAKALNIVGRFAWGDGAVPQAAAILEEALVLTRTLDEPHELVDVLQTLGDAYRDQDLYSRAAPLYEESLAQAHALGNQEYIAGSYHVLGELVLLQEDYPRALALEQASIAIFRATGVDWGITLALLNAGIAALHQGNDMLAAQYAAESIQASPKAWTSLPCIVAFAALAVKHSRAERAVRLLGATEALLARYGASLAHVHRREYERTVAATRQQLEPNAWKAAWAEGRAMTLEQAVAYALSDET